jgi:lipopolysaccharide/colanic/teichoic acid biosynthesis glycosyltransferase
VTARQLTYRVAKSCLDVCLATAALIVLAPLLAVIALCIWLGDPGAPVIFRQSRCGYGGRRFELLKFRTMVRDADALKESLRERSLVAWPDFRVTDDPRVTRLGRLLRRTSLDELPQLVNVLRGDMSLVGPRPTSFDATTYALWQTARLDFRPGITGPWQVAGRNSMDFTERCRLEISFFRRRSLARELWLLVRTAGCVIRRTGVA